MLKCVRNRLIRNWIIEEYLIILGGKKIDVWDVLEMVCLFEMVE